MAHLTLDQRYEIEAYRNAGKSILEIADYIGKDKSSIYREIKRNSAQRSGIYKGKLAEKKAKDRHTLKPKSCKFNANVEASILYHLSMDYSPEQAVGRAKIEGREIVSIESIYQYVWLSKRKGGTIHKCLRNQGKSIKKEAI